MAWIEYGGKAIWFSDYEGCKTTEEMVEILYAEVDMLNSQTEKVLVMANYHNSFGSAEYMYTLKKFGTEVLKNKIEKTATLGITGVKRALSNSYIYCSGQQNIKLFDDKIQALKWLTNKSM